MVINIMTVAPARDDRIQTRVSILESLVSMLNADESLPRETSKQQVRPGSRSRFQNALHAKFDLWIKTKKVDPSPDDLYELQPWRFTLSHRLADDGVAVFFLDFEPPRGTTGPLTPEVEAQMWFGLFLTIPGRKLLSRCSKCGRYFLRKRLPKGDRQPSHGDFCPEHRSQSRILSTQAARKLELTRRIKKAADLALEWNLKTRMKQWEWVEMKLKRKRIWVEKKWITVHKEEIRSEMARLVASRIK